MLFVPFGRFACALASTWSWWKTGAAALATSLVLETAQHAISTGSFDTSDLVVNTAGALVGWSVFVAVRRVAGEHTSVVMARVCVVVSVLALVAVIASSARRSSTVRSGKVVVDLVDSAR